MARERPVRAHDGNAKEVIMSMFVLTLTGFAGAMGIPVFLTAAAESAASSFKGAVRSSGRNDMTDTAARIRYPQ
jgi:hypothetical protein